MTEKTFMLVTVLGIVDGFFFVKCRLKTSSTPGAVPFLFLVAPIMLGIAGLVG